jgi:hypothetical protein
MAKFWVGFTNFATATTNKTGVKIIGAANKSIEVVEIGAFGPGASGVVPADIQHNVNAGFLTNAGAGTPGASPTPEPFNKIGSVSGNTAGTAYSAESTAYVTNVFQLFSFNQRGGMRWSVPQGEGFKPDANANFSFGWRVISHAVGAIDGNCMWWE